MLEGLAAWVINNYLGKYVENLNTDQLSIALLQGAVELENLPLKKDALRRVGLPIQVKAGVIGKVKLKVPVSQITTAPWELLMEQLYLIVGPIHPSERDEEAEEQALQEYKMSLLDSLEARWKSEQETFQDTNYYASSYSSWLGLSMSFATNIIENLQLKVKDVHLRYEDDATINGEMFAFGIKIDSLSAQSCDDAWIPRFLSCYNSSMSYKLLEMSGFSIYWDKMDKDTKWGDLDLYTLSGAMNTSDDIQHNYLMSPVCAKAQIKRNRSEHPLRSRTNPRIACDLILDQVSLSLAQWQYRQIVGCQKGLIKFSQSSVNGRPGISVKDSPRDWWKYAISRVMKPLPTWDTCRQRAKDNVAYVTIYTKTLINSSSPLSPENKLFKENFEWKTSFEDLQTLREIAMSRVQPPPLAGKGVQRQGLSVLVNWFPQWWGWHSSTSPSAITTPSETSLSIEGQILDALADTVENNTLLKRDTVFGQFNFTLKQGTFILCEKTSDPVMELQFENVTANFESRPRNGSHSFSTTLGALYLRDHFTADSAFPVLISPQRYEPVTSGRPSRNLPPGLAKLINQTSAEKDQPLFHLSYEYKPFGAATDYKLQVHSKSLDVVYNPGAVKWIADFFITAYQNYDPGLRHAAKQGYNAMKRKTKQQLLINWENLLCGHLNNRKTWDVELDISAPQIFLVEHFTDKNAVLCVVDFGKLHLTNLQKESLAVPLKKVDSKDGDEEDEAFQTPCSTPPGSEASDSLGLESPPNQAVDAKTLSELLLHNKLYDTYTVCLSDLQILVGRVKDNWKFAHLKGTSALHVLDRFNISLQVERRVVYTMDPQFPSLTISGNLPKLVVHVNEQKVQALRTLLVVVSGKGLISPLRSQENSPVSDTLLENGTAEGEFSEMDENLDTGAKLLMLQFSVDQMALEVQSRGRSIVELQVNGVKTSFMKRPYDTSLTLSVHGLLLVDALQTFGPDFELLVASHKHVGMDSVSGSLQDSEPTSPTSPASPDPDQRKTITSPVAITQALSTLNVDKLRVKSPVGNIQSPLEFKPSVQSDLDLDALITVELLFVNANCPTNGDNKEHLQVANIQFNNLDIIANQETIVELVGFVRRVFPQQPKASHSSYGKSVVQNKVDAVDYAGEQVKTGTENILSPTIRTQLTFDFHRLNILLLRAVVSDSGLVGRKIATSTMTEAKIHANVGNSLEVDGSLGGLQILDLTPEGQTHQRILSLGEDPLIKQQRSQSSEHILATMAAEMYNMSGHQRSHHPVEDQAFSFSLKRSPITPDTDVAEISIKMASVWYTHSPQLLFELHSCAEEFKQYLSNLARSIGSAATEMAIGLVHTRTESLAHSLSMGGRLYGSSGDVSQTPRKRMSYSAEYVEINSKGTNTPLSPSDQSPCTTLIKWDIILASPVVVLPQNSSSTHVAVANLGSITVKNTSNSPATSPWMMSPYTSQCFFIQIRDINLFTLNIQNRLTKMASEKMPMLADKLYCCGSEGKPVLHDTSVQLSVVRELGRICMRNQDDMLFQDSGADFVHIDQQETLQINGRVVTPLKLSLSRHQYEQLLDTVDTCLNDNVVRQEKGKLSSIKEEPEMHTGVPTLNMDPALRARMMLHTSTTQNQLSAAHSLALSLSFELPVLIVELVADLGVGEQGLVALSFQELIIQFDKSHSLETNVQVSLKSLVMEDLQKDAGSKHRYIMVSSTDACRRGARHIPLFVSKSCPNLVSPHSCTQPWHSSLPDRLQAEHVLGATPARQRHITAIENSMENRMKRAIPECPYTPPPSPRGNHSPSVYNEDNLVHVNVSIKPPSQIDQNTVRHTTVNFNSLDVIVNIESWLVVLDFFGISDIDEEPIRNETTHKEICINEQDEVGNSQGDLNSELEISVRSLSVMLNRAEYEVGRAVMSKLNARLVSTSNSGLTETEASVGSLSLSDLTPNHSHLYKEKFITSGLKLYMTKYNTLDSQQERQFDIMLKMDMSCLVYVHTQRFIAELQVYFRLFPHFRRRIGYNKGNDTLAEDDENTVSTRILLDLHAASPIILLPVCSQSGSVLIADLGKLTVQNKLLMYDTPGTGISSGPSKDVLLDVMTIELESMDLFPGIRHTESKSYSDIELGSYCVERKGSSLLTETCHLRIHVERNLMPLRHLVPDLSIQGTLSTLAATLSLEDYKMLNGILLYNIGECLDDLNLPQEITNIDVDEAADVWTVTYMNFELVDVSVRLIPSKGTPLTCINFIKSRLIVENFSNKTQDIDLISQEILITDTRFSDEPANKRSNVFTNILQPIYSENVVDSVQAQVHHRKRLDLSKFTILLNNMRLMAILDWWESVQEFIMTKPDVLIPVSMNNQMHSVTEPSSRNDVEVPFELKLNITDSEIVVVEDSSQWDSNAVILKSTTVVTYRPIEIDKPISCNLNHCEMFSCLLGMEDETALSIIDPVTINMEIVCIQNSEGTINKILKIQMVHLSLRLSYNDMKMFSQMLQSLPKQTQAAKKHVSLEHPVNFQNQLEQLKALGFRMEDCYKALNQCGGQLDDAALWLTQNATPASYKSSLVNSPTQEGAQSIFSFNNLEVQTDGVSICVIDDCGDVDVPFMEFLLTDLKLNHDMDIISGTARAVLAAHYYNRLLSGWEPFVEPWSFTVCWDHCVSSSLTKSRMEWHIASVDALNFNVTGSLVELYRTVKDSWTQDYYTPKEILHNRSEGKSPPGYRRRSPFVPFALRNDTGAVLWYATIIGTSLTEHQGYSTVPDEDLHWILVEPGATVPFSFHEQGKLRHIETHNLKTHQITIRVDGWCRISPVSVDKVGIYFRQTSCDLSSGNSEGLPQARIVLEVTLEGSARKVVTVRSALQIKNHLNHTVEVKLDHAHLYKGTALHLTITPESTLSVPLMYAMAKIWTRPLKFNGPAGHYHTFCTKPLDWHCVNQPGEVIHESKLCPSSWGQSYRFCAAIKRENYPMERAALLEPYLHSAWMQPAHTIILLPPLKVVNHLPYELHFSIKDVASGRVKPGNQATIHEVDITNSIEISFHLDNFPRSGTLVVPAGASSILQKIRICDQSRRKLYLQAKVTCHAGAALKVTIFVPFWILNKTALPLVFRQEGVITETAGQYEEHEVARMVAPLLFSFSDYDASPTVVARVGSGVHPEGLPQWCRPFTLQPGVQVRRLRISLKDNRPDLVYIVGIEIRPGRGQYRSTRIITLSAYYQIHNKSSYKLQFTQKCFATTVSDPGAQATYLTAVPNCFLPFHWPRLDKDQLLCVRLMDVRYCHWSGGFRIDDNNSFHLNIRDSNEAMYFLRIEILLQGAAYFIVITDADTMPPPIRVDNFSQVSLQFHQTGMTRLVSKVKPLSSVAYAWDEPTLPSTLTVIAPGGISAVYDLNKLEEGPGLTYENFIYIAFTGTFKDGGADALDVECQQLVLDVPDSDSCKVVLSRKQHGARSQLWRMTADGHLQHEGSSPPRAPPDKIMVLDICGPAPQPSQYVGLMIRRPDKRRTSTQSWRFTPDGRLCCAHNNMCVQAKDGFFGLRRGNEAVLGPPQPLIFQTTNNGIPLEQAVSRQRLRPGSGFLAVKTITDGPTRVLQISDIKETRKFITIDGGSWFTTNPVKVEEAHSSALLRSETQLTVELKSVGVSLISQRPPEELVFIHLSEIRIATMFTSTAEMIEASIQDIQVDSQLFEAQCSVMMYVTPNTWSTDPEEAAIPALYLSAERTLTNHSYNAIIFKYLLLRVKNMSFTVDERPILELFAFAGWEAKDDNENTGENDFETQRILAEASSVHAQRFYFGCLQLIFPQLRLSVLTSSKLSERLTRIKRMLGVVLVKFEGAAVELEPFCRNHSFENSQFLINAIIKHYKNELKSQGAVILGSVDFLGNPLGLINDFSEGVTGLLYEGNVGALVKNVTHGISNSAAKFTESLGDSLGRVILDDAHEEMRQRIKSRTTGKTGDHIVAGLKGFSIGILGGFTSVFRQTYDGAASDGLQGFISGLGRGLVGTVTKPVVGMLDLATETASAVRDSSRSSSRQSPARKRLPRCVTSPSGLLPMYSSKQSKGQQFLYSINKRNYAESFMAYEVLRSTSEDMQIVISSENVRVFSTSSSSSPTLIYEKHLNDLYYCSPLVINGSDGQALHYIELIIKMDAPTSAGIVGHDLTKRPKFRCDSESTTLWVSQQVNYAKARYVEKQHTLVSASDSLQEETS